MTIIKTMIAMTTLLYSLSGFAWSEPEHRVIAQIAYDRLTPDVKQQIDHLVDVFSQDYPGYTDITDLAPWPDNLRKQKIELFTNWHYIDNAFSTDGTPLKNLMDTDNSIKTVKLLEVIAANSAANQTERARSLAFLIHIVGDIHQPLHNVSRISQENPEGDRGANLFFVVDPENTEKKMTLHALWDNALYLDNRTDIRAYADRVTKDYPEGHFAGASLDLSPDDWAEEGVAIAQTVIYNLEPNQLPNSDYLDNGRRIAEQRVALAGYRLANLLNNLYKTKVESLRERYRR